MSAGDDTVLVAPYATVDLSGNLELGDGADRLYVGRGAYVGATALNLGAGNDQVITNGFVTGDIVSGAGQLTLFALQCARIFGDVTSGAPMETFDVALASGSVVTGDVSNTVASIEGAASAHIGGDIAGALSFNTFNTLNLVLYSHTRVTGVISQVAIVRSAQLVFYSHSRAQSAGLGTSAAHRGRATIVLHDYVSLPSGLSVLGNFDEQLQISIGRGFHTSSLSIDNFFATPVKKKKKKKKKKIKKVK